MKKLLIISASLAFSMSADATSMIVGGLSYHYDRSSMTNEVNPAIGVEYNGFSVIYADKNSIEQKSVQLSYGDTFYNYWWGSIGYRVGVASGYKKGQLYANGEKYFNGFEIAGGIAPLAALEFTINTGIPNLQLVTDVTPSVIMAAFKYNL